jgi:hypothetical protein
MEIEYQFTIDDGAAWAALHASRSPHMRRVMNHRRGFIVTLILGLGCIVSIWQASFIYLGIALLFGLPWFLAWPVIFRHRVANGYRQLVQETKRICLGHPHQLRILPEGLASHCDSSDWTTRWAAFSEVIETRKHVFISLGGGTALVIPRHSVLRGDLDAFLANVRQNLQGAGA